MRLVHIAHVEEERLIVPEAFQRTLGLYSGAKVYLQRSLYNSVDRRRESDDSNKGTQIIISPIPPSYWPNIIRLSVRLRHNAGALHRVTALLSEMRINILLMEGYGRYPAREGWWSAVLQLTESTGSDRNAAKVLIVKKFMGAMREESRNPFPSNLKPEDVLEHEFRLETREKRPLLLIEDMSLTDIRESKKQGPGEVTFDGTGIPLGETAGSDNYRGLLFSNTDEHFMTFVPANIHVELDLEVDSRYRTDYRAGVGVLEKITELLSGYKCEGVPCPINIIFIYNYLTQITKVEASDGERVVERSRIKMYLENPDDWDLQQREQQLVHWRAVLDRLTEVRTIDDFKIVDRDGSSVTIWRSGHKRGTKLRGDGGVEEVNSDQDDVNAAPAVDDSMGDDGGREILNVLKELLTLIGRSITSKVTARQSGLLTALMVVIALPVANYLPDLKNEVFWIFGSIVTVGVAFTFGLYFAGRKPTGADSSSG